MLAVDTSTNGYVAVKKETSGDVIIPMSAYKDGEVIFQTPNTGTFDITYNAKTFTDIRNHWATGYITFTSARHLFQGIGNDLFSPDTSMTRAMFATVLSRLDRADLTEYTTSRFTDVPTEQWYSASIEWAADKGIVNGYGGGLFGPDDEITREQMAVMLARYIAYKQSVLPAGATTIFNDEANINSWALEAVKMIQAAGIVQGKPGNIYDPQGMATRAEVAAIFSRFIEIYINHVLETETN